jgi:hypothetical protein
VDSLVRLGLEPDALAKLWEPVVSAGVPPELLLTALRSRIAAVSERVAEKQDVYLRASPKAGDLHDAE